MFSYTRLITWVIAGCAFLFSGCLYSREIAHMRRSIEDQYPDAQFDRQVVVSVGPLSMQTLTWIAGLVPDEEAQLARDLIRNIRRVQVGVYNVEGLHSVDGVELERLERFEKDGWQLAVKAREEDGAVWLFYNERRGDVRDLYLLALDDENLVIARVRGSLRNILQAVMADQRRLFRIVDDSE